MNIDPPVDTLKPFTITMSPLAASDLFTIITEFVPKREARGTLRRLRVGLRASGYPTEDELHSAAGVELRQRFKDLADMKGVDEINIADEHDEDEEI